MRRMADLCFGKFLGKFRNNCWLKGNTMTIKIDLSSESLIKWHVYCLQPQIDKGKETPYYLFFKSFAFCAAGRKWANKLRTVAIRSVISYSNFAFFPTTHAYHK